MRLSFIFLLLLAGVMLRADEPSFPAPPKTDLPYLLLGGQLVPTDVGEAQEQQSGKKKKDETTYTLAGEHAKARTPLTSPIFLLKQDSLDVQRLEVYAFEVKDGHREVTFSKRKAVQAFTLTIKKVDEALYRMEVNESLPPGEYAITPSGSNQVFCFAVY
jgi:hypothetical protein